MRFQLPFLKRAGCARSARSEDEMSLEGRMKSRPAVIVLAAGTGSRCGAPGHKLAQHMGASTVLGTTLRHALASHLPVVVVTTELLAETARRHVASRDIVVLPAVGSASP